MLFVFLSLHSLIIDIFIAEREEFTITTESNEFHIYSTRKQESIRTEYLTVSTNSSNEINIRDSQNSYFIDELEYGKQVIIKSETPISLNNISYSGEFVFSVGNALVRSASVAEISDFSPSVRNESLYLTESTTPIDSYEKPFYQIKAINRIGLEDYVAGVIAPEIGGNAPLEAMKAQAVATRTYTMARLINNNHKIDGFDLCSSTHCQVYRGLNGQTNQSKRAALETANLILMYENQPIEAFYSSTCGGISEFSGNLWSVQHPYLTAKPDYYCINIDAMPSWSRRNINWERNFTTGELEDIFSIRNIRDIQINKVNSSMRIEEVLIKSKDDDIFITGQYRLRDTFGLPSSLFIIQKDRNNVKFIGNGHGHGVGMCQIGAIVRASKGYDFREILEFYYENAEIIMENR